MDKLKVLEIEEIEGIDFENEEEKQRFQIENREQLSWAMRKIKAINEEAAEITAAAEVELKRIKEWHEAECRRIEQRKSFFESLITIYAMKKRIDDGEFKTESTPYGRVTFTKQQPKWNYDENKLLSWLMESDNLELIKVERKPRKDEIKKRFVIQGSIVVDTETGEAVPGILVEDQGEKINIKISSN